jgi:hypothetical protein
VFVCQVVDCCVNNLLDNRDYMLPFTRHRQNSARRGVNSLAQKVSFLVMLCAVFCSVDALAAWGEKNVQRESRVTQVSVRDGTSNNLGVFAGVVPVKEGAELFKSACLVVAKIHACQARPAAGWCGLSLLLPA